MSSLELESKYSYRFTVAARKLEPPKDEPEKAEIQAYINEILGVKKEKSSAPG